MAIRPVQLIALGFTNPDFHGEIIAELERLHQSGTVRVIDSLAVYKDSGGELEAEHLSNLSEDEAIELGSKIGALIGLGFEGEEGMGGRSRRGRRGGGRRGRRARVHRGRRLGCAGGHPRRLRGSAHLARAPLGGAAARRGRARRGLPHQHGFISPLDLVALGLVSAEEARELHELETASAAGSTP